MSSKWDQMRKRAGGVGLLVAALQTPLLPAAAQPAPRAEIFSPLQHGQNNDATDRGLEFSIPQVDDLADFHGDASTRASCFTSAAITSSP